MIELWWIHIKIDFCKFTFDFTLCSELILYLVHIGRILTVTLQFDPWKENADNSCFKYALEPFSQAELYCI